MTLTLPPVSPPYGGVGTYHNKKNYKNQPFMLEECFTYQNVEKELLCKRTKKYCYSMLITMVTMTSNSGVEVCSKKCFEKIANGLLAVNISGSEYFWLSSGRREMEGREKVYFTTEETTIYPKSLGIYLKSS